MWVKSDTNQSNDKSEFMGSGTPFKERSGVNIRKDCTP